MTLWDAVYDFFGTANWNTLITYMDDAGSYINIDITDFLCSIIGIILIVSMFKLFGIVIKKVLH